MILILKKEVSELENEMNKGKEVNQEELQIKLHLKGRHKEWFLELKEKFGLQYNVEVIRFIIKKVHDLEFNKGGE